MKVLAIIPARSGSKGVPGKNKIRIDGKPLISYTFEAAIQSQGLTDLWLSTDDKDIIGLGEKFGVKIHFRPPHLATDNSPITDTIAHILEQTEVEPDAIMILQPTSPLRSKYDIDDAIKILKKQEKTQSVISVVAMDDVHPARMYKLDGLSSHLEPYSPELEELRRQDIPPAYYRNGAIYLTRTSAFKKNHSVMNKPISPHIMDTEWLLNIDSQRDLLIANALIPVWKKKGYESN